MNASAPDVGVTKIVPSGAARWHRVAVYVLAVCAAWDLWGLLTTYFVAWYSGSEDLSGLTVHVAYCAEVGLEVAAAIVAIVTLRKTVRRM